MGAQALSRSLLYIPAPSKPACGTYWVLLVFAEWCHSGDVRSSTACAVCLLPTYPPGPDPGMEALDGPCRDNQWCKDAAAWSCSLVTSSHLPFSLVQGCGGPSSPGCSLKGEGQRSDMDAPVLAGELRMARLGPRTIEQLHYNSPYLPPWARSAFLLKAPRL